MHLHRKVLIIHPMLARGMKVELRQIVLFVLFCLRGERPVRQDDLKTGSQVFELGVVCRENVEMQRARLGIVDALRLDDYRGLILACCAE